MNEFRVELRDGSAYVALEVCRTEGDRCLYQDRAVSRPVEVWCIPGSEKLELVKDGALQEQHCRRSFTVPRQEGFPPEFEPSHDAQVRYGDWDWAVESWSADSLQACYVLQTTRHVPRRVNVTE